MQATLLLSKYFQRPCEILITNSMSYNLVELINTVKLDTEKLQAI